MKAFYYFVQMAITCSALGTTVSAQSTSTATASATIVNPFAIEKSADMNFGKLSVETSIGGTVTIVPSGSRLKSGGVNLSTSGSITQATFTITGTEMYSYSVSLPSMVLLKRSNGAETMIADTFTSNALDGGVLSAGIQFLYVGATLKVAAAQAPGVYASSQFDVTVNYN